MPLSEMGLVTAESPKQQFEGKCREIATTLEKLLHTDNASRDEWHILISTVYNICYSLESGTYYLTHALKQIFPKIVAKIRPDIWKREESKLFEEYVKKWRKFYFLSTVMPGVFRDLETSETDQTQDGTLTRLENSTVHYLMLNAWNTTMFSETTSRDELLAATMHKIEEQWEGRDNIHQSDIKIICQSFAILQDVVGIDLYDVYQEMYIKSMTNFYAVQADGFIYQHGVLKYLAYAEDKLNEERHRLQQCLNAQCDSEKCMSVLVDVLVKSKIVAFEAEFNPLVTRKDFSKLGRMHQLIQHVPNHRSQLPKQLETFIISKGKEDMKYVVPFIDKKPIVYIDKLLALYAQFTELIQSAFLNDPHFLTARDKALKQVVNDTSIFSLKLRSSSEGVASRKTHVESRIPQLLADYCNALFRNNTHNKLQNDQIEAKLKDVIQILKYVDNKDVFMRYYREHLRRRLFLQNSRDIEIEESMALWLRESGMPSDYIRELFRLFQDIRLCSDLNTELKQRFYDTGRFSYCTCNILTMSKWYCCNTTIAVKLPQEFADYISEVERFYNDRHPSRQLTWNHALSIGTLRYFNNQGRYDLKLTTFQITVLLALDKQPNQEVSYESLRLITELDDLELKRTLAPLITRRVTALQVLICTPQVKTVREIEDQTLLRLNDEFATLKNGRIQKKGNVNLVGNLQMVNEKTKPAEEAEILQARAIYVREAITAIMKTHKTMRFEKLQDELVDMLQQKRQFFPSLRMIKEQIEYLLTKEICIRRDEEDMKLFFYVA